MIRFHDVTFSYDGKRSALTIPDLTIDPGLTLVVGPNGAGKTTLLRLAAGVEHPTRGSVTIGGVDLWVSEAAARQSIAYVPEHPELTPYATIADVLRLVAHLRGADDSAVAEALATAGLADEAWRTVREVSMGQRRRALFATALIGDPSVVILDEPLETMDAQMRQTIVDWVLARRAAGATVLLATHDLDPFMDYVDKTIVVQNGQAEVR